MKVAIEVEIYLANGTMNNRGAIFELSKRNLFQLSSIRDALCDELKKELPDGAISDIKVFWAPYTGGRMTFKEIKSKQSWEV